MGKLLIPLAALLSGVALLVVGTGLMFAAIGAQAGNAHFSSLVTGLVMSAYFAGAIYGTYACPHIIRKVGFIRAFAAMASVASTLPLLHAMSRGTPEQAKLIRKAIENGGHGNMSAVFAAIESTGGITYTAQAAQQEADQAIAAIEPLPASPYKEALYSLAEFSVNRAY